MVPKGQPGTRTYGGPAGTKEGQARLSPDVEPWEIQPEEPWEAFQGFALYRDLGPKRTIPDAARADLERSDPSYSGLDATGKALAESRRFEVMRKWGHRWRWTERVRAWERRLDEERTRAQLDAQRKAVEAAAKRHAQMAEGVSAMAYRYLQKFHSQDEGKRSFGEKRLEDMTIGEFLATHRQGTMIERLVLGMDRADELERNEARAQGNRSPALSREELQEIARQAAAEARAAEPSPDVELREPTDESDAADVGDGPGRDTGGQPGPGGPAEPPLPAAGGGPG